VLQHCTIQEVRPMPICSAILIHFTFPLRDCQLGLAPLFVVAAVRQNSFSLKICCSVFVFCDWGLGARIKERKKERKSTPWGYNKACGENGSRQLGALRSHCFLLLLLRLIVHKYSQIKKKATFAVRGVSDVG